MPAFTRRKLPVSMTGFDQSCSQAVKEHNASDVAHVDAAGEGDQMSGIIVIPCRAEEQYASLVASGDWSIYS